MHLHIDTFIPMNCLERQSYSDYLTIIVLGVARLVASCELSEQVAF